jgi:hypothetical protein
MLQGKKISSEIRQKSESQQKLNEHKIYGARTACTNALNAAMAVGAGRSLISPPPRTC